MPLSSISTLEEANGIVAELKERVQEIESQLADKSKRDGGGVKLTDEEYERWHAKASHAKMILGQRLRELRLYIKKRWSGFGGTFQPPARIITAWRDALSSGRASEEDILLFLANPDLVRKNATLLDRARGCAVAAPPVPRARMLQLIALLTRADQDLNELEDLRYESTGHAELLAEIALLLACAYLEFGLIEEAEKTVLGIPVPVAAVRAWRSFYRQSGENKYLERARDEIDKLSPIERLCHRCILVESTRSDDDLRPVREAFPAAFAGETGPKRKRRVVLHYTNALLACGLVEHARQTVDDYAPGDPSCLFQIASVTKSPDDLARGVRSMPSAGIEGMLFDRAIGACIACGSFEIAETIIAGCNDERRIADTRCRIALETGHEDDLSIAARSLCVQAGQSMDWPRLNYLFALLKARRIGEAKVQIEEFDADEYRCKACLQVYCAENGLEYPRVGY